MKRDVIVVLGAAVRANGQPSQAMRRRVDHALELARKRADSLLLFTGGLGVHAPAEADAMAAVAREAGVAEERIRLEAHATNTAESARLCARLVVELAREVDLGEVVLVTDAYHQRRTRFAFRRLGVPAISSSPKNSPPPGVVRRVREIVGLFWYGLTLR